MTPTTRELRSIPTSDAIPRMAEEHEHFQFAIRALDLAVLIGDAERTERTRTTLMDVHRGLMKSHSRTWWYTVDRLLDDKKAGVTDDERAELIADLNALHDALQYWTSRELRPA